MSTSISQVGKTAYIRHSRAPFTVQLKLSGTAAAALAASGFVEVSNDAAAKGATPDSARWEQSAYSLSGTGAGAGVSADGAAITFSAPWSYVRINQTAISGAGAVVDINVAD